MSLNDVTRLVPIAPSHLARFELGKSQLGAGNLLRLSALYGKSINDLLAEADTEVSAR